MPSGLVYIIQNCNFTNFHSNKILETSTKKMYEILLKKTCELWTISHKNERALNHTLQTALYPFLNLSNKTLIVKNTNTQTPVDINPPYTVGSLIDHPLWVIDLKHSVDLVRGS